MEAFQVFLIVFFGVIVLVFLFTVFWEPLYVLLFNKPFYIHWYPFIKKIKPSQRNILSQEFPFYQRLSNRQQQFFEHRLVCFLAKYQFIGKANFVITDQCKVLVSATFIMLTFGMRHYLIDVFNKIIIYPERYFSNINKEFHKGEFNPQMKVLVFSWQDFQEGFRIGNDNINLGLHEFSHALYFHGLNGKDQSSIVFAEAYIKIQKYLTRPNVLKQMVQSSYFRIYAYTNQVEFLAVILEHFFETPHLFKKQFPELYNYVKEMINFEENTIDEIVT